MQLLVNVLYCDQVTEELYLQGNKASVKINEKNKNKGAASRIREHIFGFTIIISYASYGQDWR